MRGLRSVPIGRIAGSVGRYQDFDERFRLKPHAASERYLKILEAMRAGTALPPVKLYQIRDDYFILDGNHRVAAARQLGHDEILAHVVELVPSEKTLQNLLYRERAEFCDRTGLPAAIDLSEVGQYPRLLTQIAVHQAHLQGQGGAAVDFPAAAQDWYRTIYKPLCDIIRRGRLLEFFPERNLADLYAYISVHRWEEGRRRDYGIDIERFIPADMEVFRQNMSARKTGDYPEMQRGITAFILMNVQARKEDKIVDRLYEMKEVREVHSVHGDVDLLVKIQLTRDLLSSDAEMISQFVQRVRQLAGITSTKTLIPGFSKIKATGE